MFSLESYFNYAVVKAEIEQAEDPGNKSELRSGIEARGIVDKVLEGIHLGNDEKFVETMGDKYTCKTEKGVAIDTSNPHKFEVIISSCSWKRMLKAMPDLKKYAQEDVEKSFQERKFTWVQIGGSVPDDKFAWTDLVYNATFPRSAFTKIDLEIPREREKQTEPMLEHRKTKKAEIDKLPASEWFKETFSILDEAVTNSKKTLVHCHAGGSRSPALLAAYLINRFDVTADQAIAFLRTKRDLVNPKCKDDLKAYHAALQQLKA